MEEAEKRAGMIFQPIHIEKAYNGLQGWVDCFEKASLKGMVGGGGIDAANTVADHVDAMKKAYELGKEL